MKKAIIAFSSVLLSFALAAGPLSANVYADIRTSEQSHTVNPPDQPHDDDPSEKPDEIDTQVAEMEDKIGKVEGSDAQFEPSDSLVEYAGRKIDLANPTKILDYSSETANFLPSDDEAREYFIKAVSEEQAGIVLYGDKDFARRTIESVVYSASYGIYLKHVKNWKIESQLIDQTNDIYRHLVTFQYNLPKSHTAEMEDRIDTIADWIMSEYKNVNIPQKMIELNHLDAKGVADLQKAMLIHDYVIKNVRPYYGDLVYYGKNKSERHSLNSAMFEGETVCQGFQLLFARLADRVGLENRLVRGYKGFVDLDKNNPSSRLNYIAQMEAAVNAANKGGRWGMESSFGANHGWNQVKIGDNWYHADMSSDSAYTNLYVDGAWPQPQRLYYKYFLKTDKEFKEPVTIPVWIDNGTDEGKIVDEKQFLVWQGSENYDTPDEPFQWTYDVLYDFQLNGGINSSPYLQDKFTQNYPMGNSWNEKGKFKFAEKDLTYVPETRYEITTPGYADGAAPVRIRKGLQTPEEALKFAGVSGMIFRDGKRTEEGYVDYGTLTAIDVKHDDSAETEEFDKIRDTVGGRVTLTAYIEMEGRRYEKKIELVVADDSVFYSSTALQLKDGAEDMITVPQCVYVNGNSAENKKRREEKIAEIDREILSRAEIVKEDGRVSAEEYPGEKKLVWKNTEFSEDNVPVSEPTKDGAYLIRTLLIRGEDNKWTGMDFRVNLTEVEKQTTTVLECDTYYIEKLASDTTGLVMPKTGKEISNGGDLERFFRFNGHRITMEWTNAMGFRVQRLHKTVYLLDEDGEPAYQTEKPDNGILLKKDENGKYTIKVEDTLNKLFSTPGTYRFRMEAFNDEDRIVVTREFTVKILPDEEIPAPEKYTVTFDENGHGIAPMEQTVENGETVDEPEEPEEEGWIFGGWYKEAACVNAYKFDTPVTGDITLYAKWTKSGSGSESGSSSGSGSGEGSSTGGSGMATPSDLTVSFDANGHGEAPEAQPVERGKKAAKPANPHESGYTFGGWYEEAACIHAYDFAEPVTDDITLYAKWTKNSSESGSEGGSGSSSSGSGIGTGSISGSGSGSSSSGSSGDGSLSSGGGRHRSGGSRSRRSGGGGIRRASSVVSTGAAGPAADQRSGKWLQDARGWLYQYEDGTYLKNAWKLASWNSANAWYAFDEAGYMRKDWFLSNGRWYYLNPAGGAMMTGWQEINGKWYYLEPIGDAAHPQGAMYANEKTPDGYTVDASGAWVK